MPVNFMKIKVIKRATGMIIAVTSVIRNRRKNRNKIRIVNAAPSNMLL